MAGKSDTISTNGTVFNSGDTLSVTITTTKITGGVNGTLYIGETEIPVSSNTLEYTYHYVLTNTGTFNVHFINNMFELDSNNIAITVNAISNVVSAFVNRLKSVFVQKSNINGLLKNDGTIDTNTYLTQHQDISGKLDKAQTSYKGKNVVVDSSSGNIAFEDKNNHTHSQYLTEHQSLANYVQKSQTNGLLKNDGTVDTTNYSTFDGNYNNLTNKPTIPTATSDLTNDSGFLTSHQNITGKEDKSNKVTSLSSSSTDTEYPSAKCVYDELESLFEDTIDELIEYGESL